MKTVTSRESLQHHSSTHPIALRTRTTYSLLVLVHCTAAPHLDRDRQYLLRTCPSARSKFFKVSMPLVSSPPMSAMISSSSHTLSTAGTAVVWQRGGTVYLYSYALDHVPILFFATSPVLQRTHLEYYPRDVHRRRLRFSPTPWLQKPPSASSASVSRWTHSSCHFREASYSPIWRLVLFTEFTCLHQMPRIFSVLFVVLEWHYSLASTSGCNSPCCN